MNIRRYVPVPFWSPPGEFSSDGVWVVFWGWHMYIGDSFVGCIIDMIKHWNDDSRLCG